MKKFFAFSAFVSMAHASMPTFDASAHLPVDRTERDQPISGNLATIRYFDFEACTWWARTPSGFTCNTYPRRVEVAEAFSVASAMNALELRIQQLEARVQELENSRGSNP
jgi:hypothetical protein